MKRSVKIAHWLLIIFLVGSLLCVTPFLLRLVNLYSHGGDKVLARLAAYEIRLGGVIGYGNKLPHFWKMNFESGCWNLEGMWGDFILSWDPQYIEKSKYSLTTSVETREIIYLQPNLVSFKRAYRSSGEHITYFLDGENWAVKWQQYGDGGVRTERQEEMLSGMTIEERRIPYRFCVDYYRSMVLYDLVWLTNLITYHKFIFFLSAFFIIPKTALQWLWLHVFAIFPGTALKYFLPFWIGTISLSIVGLVINLNRKSKE